MARVRQRPARPTKSQLRAFDPVRVGNDTYLRADERDGLEAAMPALAQLADYMGVLNKPIVDWSREQMMRFLAGAVRAAMPLVPIDHHDPDLDDEIPF